MTTVLITGSARGIGFELAKQYAEAGDRVYATTRSPERADDLISLAEQSGGLLTIHRMDVGEMTSVKTCAAELDGVAIDVLINNAGVWGGLETQVFANMDYENWAFEMNVMAMGPFRVMQNFMPHIEAGNDKKIVTMTSQTAAAAYDHEIGYSYGSAKAAVNRLMTGLATEFKDKPQIFCLMHPGWVKTDMAGDVADIEPSESASMVRDVIKGLTKEDSGKFMKWTGDIHPW